ncbi:MAG: hypothetical protein M1821_007752 [Bathelium mastoideum]|nr:MAG: hypothetical protein M1821_007752 [Bathelium mastoideum]
MKDFPWPTTCLSILFTSLGDGIYQKWHALEDDSPSQKNFKAIADLIEKSGIVALLIQDAISVYHAAARRKTTNPVDRVYAIQQIFGFRLGNSAPNASTGHNFDLGELEDQLGEQMILQHPVISQEFVHTVIPQYGKAWRIHQSTVSPYRTMLDVDVPWSLALRPKALVSLTVYQSAGTMWASFDGQTLSFSRLKSSCDSWDSASGVPTLSYDFDAHQMVARFTRESHSYSSFRLPDENDRWKMVKWLCKTFAEDHLIVLALGSHTRRAEWAEGGALNYRNGVILLRENNYWSRVGICDWRWDCDGETALDTKIFEATDDPWRHTTGLFG